MNKFNHHWHYHSEIPPKKGQMFALLMSQAKDYFFQISFDTGFFKPTHNITLRTSVTGWTRDIYGCYWYAGWRFYLPRADFAGKLWELKFLLNGALWQDGPNLVVNGDAEQHYQESVVHFPNTAPRFTHNYTNLRTVEDLQQQNILRTSCPEPADGLWDVIIIGTGMGGGVLASTLNDLPDKDFKILALDAGSYDYSPHTDNLPTAAQGRFVAEIDNSIVETHEVINYATGGNFGQFIMMNMGGRSVFWSGLIPRMHDWELNGNWPDCIVKYLKGKGYNAAEKLMRKHVTTGAFQDRVIADLEAKFPGWEIVDTPRSWHQPEWGSASIPQKHPDSFIYCSTGVFSSAELLTNSLRAVEDPTKNRLHVKLNHLATKLLTNDQEQITGVVCQDLVGNRQQIFRGKYVVLAAGSLESPKLALLSKLNDPSGKIARGLTDHPSYYAPNGDGGFILKNTSPYYGVRNHARIFFYPPDGGWQGHWFNVEIVINGQYWRVRDLDDKVLAHDTPADVPTTVHFKFVFSSPLQEQNYVALRDDGMLWVQNDANTTSDNARGTVLNLLKQLCAFFQTEPVDFNKDSNCHCGNGGTPAHAGGTLRMAVDGRPGVVDENLKFQAYQNLYVCDPSVYPYIPAANPSLTLTALALRLGDHLAAKF